MVKHWGVNQGNARRQGFGNGIGLGAHGCHSPRRGGNDKGWRMDWRLRRRHPQQDATGDQFNLGAFPPELAPIPKGGKGQQKERVTGRNQNSGSGFRRVLDL